MNKPTTYINGIYPKNAHRKLTQVRMLANGLLDALEEQDMEASDDQSMEALRSLLGALVQSIQTQDEN